MIPYSRQFISQNDIKNVTKVLKSKFITQGKKVEEFENRLSEYCNAKFAVTANSATSALHIACISLDLKKMIIYGLFLILLLQAQIVLYIVVQS